MPFALENHKDTHLHPAKSNLSVPFSLTFLCEDAKLFKGGVYVRLHSSWGRRTMGHSPDPQQDSPRHPSEHATHTSTSMAPLGVRPSAVCLRRVSASGGCLVRSGFESAPFGECPREPARCGHVKKVCRRAVCRATMERMERMRPQG